MVSREKLVRRPCAVLRLDESGGVKAVKELLKQRPTLTALHSLLGLRPLHLNF